MDIMCYTGVKTPVKLCLPSCKENQSRQKAFAEKNVLFKKMTSLIFVELLQVQTPDKKNQEKQEKPCNLPKKA